MIEGLVRENDVDGRSYASRIFGYDVFVSFALGPPPRGTQTYASDLTRRLRERDLTVFFSEDELPAGNELPNSLSVALARSKTLVVVVNEALLASPRWVRREVEEFRRVCPQSPIIPISVAGVLDGRDRYDAEAWLRFSTTKWVNEGDSALSSGVVGHAVIDQVVAASSHVSANTRWRRLSRGVATGILVLTVTASVAAALAWQSTRRAQLELRRTTSRQLAAQAPYFKDEQLDLSLLLAAEAYRTDDSPEALVSLASVLEHRPEQLSSIAFGTNEIRAIALSAKGDLLAVADGEKHEPSQIQLWTVSTMQPTRVPLRGSELAFSADGQILVAASGSEFGLWDVRSGRVLVESVSSRDEPAPSFENQFRGDGFYGRITAMSFSPDRTLLALALDDGSIRFRSVPSGELVSTIRAHPGGGINALVFHPTGRILASAGELGDGSIRLWDVATGRAIRPPLLGYHVPNSNFYRGLGIVHGIAFGPNETLFSLGQTVTLPETDNVASLHVWSLATGEVIKTIDTAAAANYASSVAIARDASVAAWPVNNTVRLRNLSDDSAPRQIATPEGNVNLIAMSAGGELLVSAGTDGLVRLWKTTTQHGSPLVVPRMTLGRRHSPITSLAVSSDAEMIASGIENAENNIVVSNAATGQELRTLEAHGYVGQLSFNGDASRIAAQSGSAFNIWRLPSGELIAPPESVGPTPVRDLLFVSANELIVAGGHNAQFWKADSYERVGPPLILGDADRYVSAYTEIKIDELALSRDRRVLATGGGSLVESIARLWNVRSQSALGDEFSAGSQITLNNDGTLLAWVDGKGIKFWDTQRRQQFRTPTTPADAQPNAIDFSVDGRLVASAGSDGAIRLWVAKTGQAVGSPIQAHRGKVTHIVFADDGHTLVTAGEDGMVRTWDVSITAWRSLACFRANRNLTTDEWRQFVGETLREQTCSDRPF